MTRLTCALRRRCKPKLITYTSEPCCCNFAGLLLSIQPLTWRTPCRSIEGGIRPRREEQQEGCEPHIPRLAAWGDMKAQL